MKREATEKCLANRAAHAMRAATVRLARERAAQDADPLLAYGCVDWFRYDATPAPAQEADTASLSAVRVNAGQGQAASSPH
jgi:hypothetical protein